MKTVSSFPYAVVEEPDMQIILSDGCRLSARVWRAEGAGPVPAVLEYIPYRKRDGTLPRDEIMHPYVAGHGYACVRVDMRGNGDSSGLMTDEYTIQELADACEVIEFLAEQPWCNGSVGMMGKSWGGFNCLQTAFLQPPALKAVVSVCATSDRFDGDIHYKGGCLLGENFGWGSVMLSYSSRPPDPALRSDWREQWLARLEAEPWLAPRWADLQERSEYWRHGSICEDWERMQVPVLIWGGWADNYMNTVAAIVGNVPGAKGIVGPWVHQYPHTAVPGPAIGFLGMAVRWWDRWLKGVRNGVEDDPAYRVYMLHSDAPDASARVRAGHWVSVGGPAAAGTVLHLSCAASRPGAFTPPGSPTDDRPNGAFVGSSVGYLSRTEKGEALAVRIATPQHLGMSAGEFFPMGLNAEMAGDQREDDALSVCFDGDVQDAPLQVLGAARVVLRLSSDKPLGFVVVRLCDVGPDGASVRIAHGMRNLCHRDSMEEPARMVPGQVVEVAFDLDQMAYRLAPGHRLRVALSNSYWPFVWPSPEAGVLTLLGGRVELPVFEGGDAWDAPEAEGAPAWRHRVLRKGHSARRVEVDLLSGKRALVVEEDGGEVENLDHGLCTSEVMSERWEIGADPSSARAVHVWEQHLSRGDWRVRTRAEAEMTGTVGALRMKARLTAWEGDTVVFEREWDDAVERRFV